MDTHSILIVVGISITTVVAVYNIVNNHLHEMEERLLTQIASVHRDVDELRGWVMKLYNDKLVK